MKRKLTREEVAAKWILWGYSTPGIADYTGPLYIAGTTSAAIIDQMLRELDAAKSGTKKL